ncbi:hypothetical protein P296_16975 [Salmonella enterica subsp. arizonae serovar 18:z4,z23:- str. CVM N26624]|uniref:Uncharacterized protein n=1 Tax=Salmonella enterica subsp. arizonae serovar 18:z4,z23:- str. CVM N26626 TaxID=1395119 RepID=A0A3S5YIY2_SALER|nr:hypothetical protein N898_03140 [Salmonella enterica subsp. arizonae serovar 62:z36:- str. RKS2983]OLV92272.1 hypothetical protein P297_10030 [Salmonella enterica subsp. arizonae serovar 18:z4,z23:- str. CVM N26625]OLV97681.1 hypothetical protein P296_16975 [Salmonella enterica subsp. arizonae serovar 18:z4,z23:- str. CVM N26624]OLV97925.1 hypothetical protein P298_17480 [Salmonella enterica subsp. arizonae serovar 18:z4,z23:- str. CVM N26626]OLW07940.1 hypothetical protein P292_07595 [Salmo
MDLLYRQTAKAKKHRRFAFLFSQGVLEKVPV